ncbi:ribonuclease Z [Tissierella sp.]|uniref:ribonuclease Z n=1 Tax=Tissierella sp. TaxID=41274 RepID=UPI002855ABC4|nr:ribonuclease Z [Tissierella sp.]MDR7856654.1 ribonuclease Z [Tissierella sp.]
MLNISLLGSGGGMPMPDRFLSSLLINYKGRKILIDCGEGTQVAMRKINSGFKSIDVICITHCHGDHIFGLPGLLSTIGNSDRTEPITIIGPAGIADVINSIMVALPYLPYDLHIIESPEGSLGLSIVSGILEVKEVEDFSNEEIILSSLELEHSAPCLGYSFYLQRKPKFYPEKAELNKVPKEIWGRLQNGETVTHENQVYEPSMVLGEERRGIKLSYITDTRPIDAIPSFINESDLFVCEGTYGDNEDLEKAIKNKHMTFAEAAELAYKGKVCELLLTHFSTAMDEPELYSNNARDIFVNTIIAYDSLSKTLVFR